MIEWNGDQSREMINTRQRFAAWRAAGQRRAGYRGSMVWSATKGSDYLLRSFYDPATGRRRQRSLGVRSEETERLKADYDRGRADAKAGLEAAASAMRRQAAVNRALGLGRVPQLAARILRALDEAGLIGHGLRLVGTHALFAYEAAAGVLLESDVTTTEDVDLLFDSRSTLRLIGDADATGPSLIRLLRRVDRSFARTRAPFRAANAEGYLVDLIKPERSPHWRRDRSAVGAGADDLEAVAIEGLVWLENAPAFEALAIDDRGAPVRLIAPDPRVFAAHKLWLSTRSARDPIQRRRDAAQARAVAALCARHFPHLPYVAGELRAVPLKVVRAAKSLFAMQRA